MRDSTKGEKIVAWFTAAIPVSDGPEGYYGLPGMILELEINNGTATISTSKITLSLEEKIVLPKQKGKANTLDLITYNNRILEYMEDCRKAERNPYWGIRY